jgi:predicted ferric reductase
VDLWWYVDRAAGLTSWLLLAASTAFGIATSTRVFGPRASNAWTLAVHRFLGALSLLFLGAHMLGVVVNPHAHVGVAASLVPLATRWHPVAMAWGIVAAWLLVAVELTSLARGRLPASLWRWVHLTSYLLFFGATVHLLAVGTDIGSHWLRLVAVVGTGSIAFLSIGAALERTVAPQP